MKSKLKPPEGYASWLHYAVSTMDTRSLHIESIVDNNWWGRIVQRAEMQDAAEKELEELIEIQITQEIRGGGDEKHVRRV